METDRHPQRGYVGWALGAVVLMAVIAVACGGPAATSEPTAQNTPQPTSTVAIADPTPTADTGRQPSLLRPLSPPRRLRS
jgi:hypothetical protein